jgi:hypothetical protein
MKDIVVLNQNRWFTKIKTLQHLNFKVYSWLIDDYENYKDVQNLIPSPTNESNWKYWIYSHPEYWLNQRLEDWHFNDEGHKQVAETMYNFITENENS